MRILAIQLNQPGDAILTTPALRWLMNQGHEVHALLQPLGAELLQTMPGLASVEALPRGTIQVVRDLRRAIRYHRIGFDWAIVFSQCSDRPALWALLSGAKKRTGLRASQNQHLGRWRLINDWQWDSVHFIHSVENHVFLAGGTLEDARALPLEYQPPAADQAWAADWLRRKNLASGRYLLLHCGARWTFKYWPMANLARFISLARTRLGLPVIVTCGRDPFEINFTRELVAQAPPDHHEIGTLTISQLGALMQNSAAFVGVDSMPMHLAAALGKPGLALFGPTDVKVWGPWHSRLVTLRTDCRCLRENQRFCGQGTVSECLAALSAEFAVENLAAILKASSP